MGDPVMRCAITGIEIRNSGEAVWDDGEWISLEYISRQLAEQEDGAGEASAPAGALDSKRSAEIAELIDQAIFHEKISASPFPNWGRVGELYVAERFGVELSRPHAQGHDGRLGNELVEIKTITPRKQKQFVRVKRAGNYSLLAVVRVDEHYNLDARLIRRDRLPANTGGEIAIVAWSTACRIGHG
jgi:hypothetical protein